MQHCFAWVVPEPQEAPGYPSYPPAQAVSGLQLSLDLIFLAARNVLGVCLNPGVKPTRFCLKLQCFEVKTTNIYFTLPFCPDEVPHLLAIVKIAQWPRVSVIWPYLGGTVKHYVSVSLVCVPGYFWELQMTLSCVNT